MLADSVQAIITYQSMLEECVVKVVNENGNENCSQDNLRLERTSHLAFSILSVAPTILAVPARSLSRPSSSTFPSAQSLLSLPVLEAQDKRTSARAPGSLATWSILVSTHNSQSLGDHSEHHLHARHKLMTLCWQLRGWTRQSAAARRTCLESELHRALKHGRSHEAHRLTQLLGGKGTGVRKRLFLHLPGSRPNKKR